MAKIANVLVTEANRQAPTEWAKIHLFQMGDFYRAYEWSAWLTAVIAYNDEVRRQSKDRKPLKLSRKRLAQSETTFCFVGFPIKSVEKFIPARTDFQSVENKHIVITIPMPQPQDGSEVTYERLHEAFLKWKDSIPLSDKPDTVDDDGQKRPPKPKTPAVATVPAASPSGKGGGILSQILGYQLQAHTDADNRQFIASLQQQIAAIL